METLLRKNVYEELRMLTNNMVYVSQSECDITVHNWGGMNMPEVYDKIAEMSGAAVKDFEHSNIADFFENVIYTSGEDVDAKSLTTKKLMTFQYYLVRTFRNVLVIRAGRICVHIFIVGQAPDGSRAMLHTTAIQSLIS
ncbi:nuclease A inhibitor family protein [Taibaiella soli]|uniref:Uncharacterized protein n=1 Tax=Taibaiella soli TaxID=1649169 RepID=A0A2W2AII9_9BACT|nr:nuclease A inhibitor family protein [Taibaiella soli]PZF73402.1 hypothetical protein DN068_08400 [Taibaiella soli]